MKWIEWLSTHLKVHLLTSDSHNLTHFTLSLWFIVKVELMLQQQTHTQVKLQPSKQVTLKEYTWIIIVKFHFTCLSSITVTIVFANLHQTATWAALLFPSHLVVTFSLQKFIICFQSQFWIMIERLHACMYELKSIFNLFFFFFFILKLYLVFLLFLIFLLLLLSSPPIKNDVKTNSQLP